MIETEAEGLTSWQQRFIREAGVRFPAKIRHALEDRTTFARPEKASELVGLVHGARVASENLETRQIADLVQLTFDTLLISGAAPGFAEYQEFFDSSLELIELIHRRDGSVSELLLSAARFQAGLANGDALRRRLIERAVMASREPGELVPALLTLAKFLIDVSDYPGARRLIAQCIDVMRDGTHPEFSADLAATTGLSYYYTDPDLAVEYFNEAIRIGREMPHRSEVAQPMANATHFLGRMAADSGEYQRALGLYVEGERLSDAYLTGHGFYHQRLAEVLVDFGEADEALYHLREAEDAFRRVGQVSNGLALLEGVWARWYMRCGEPNKAEQALRAAIARSRKDTVPRAELTLLVELARLKLSQRRVLDAARYAARAGSVYLRVEIGRDPRTIYRQVRTALRVLRKILAGPRPHHHAPVSCPCGAVHSTEA